MESNIDPGVPLEVDLLPNIPSERGQDTRRLNTTPRDGVPEQVDGAPSSDTLIAMAAYAVLVQQQVKKKHQSRMGG